MIPDRSPGARAGASAAIVLDRANKWYGAAHVLRDVSLTAAGRNASVGFGQVDHDRCINRLEKHPKGRIIVDGTELTDDTCALDAADSFLERVRIAEQGRTTRRSFRSVSSVSRSRALCMRPRIKLFDEPTSALDPEIKEVLGTMIELGMTMVCVTR